MQKFNYKGTLGAINAELAKFGRFQTGTSIQAPLFYPHIETDGCKDMVSPDHIKEGYNMDWRGFVILQDGGCTYEEKARRVEKMGV